MARVKYPRELKEQVLKAINDGMTTREAAETFKVSESNIYLWRSKANKLARQAKPKTRRRPEMITLREFAPEAVAPELPTGNAMVILVPRKDIMALLQGVMK